MFEGAVDRDGDVVVLADGLTEFFEEEEISHVGVCAGIDVDCAPLKCIIRPIPVQFPEVLQGTSEA